MTIPPWSNPDVAEFIQGRPRADAVAADPVSMGGASAPSARRQSTLGAVTSLQIVLCRNTPSGGGFTQRSSRRSGRVHPQDLATHLAFAARVSWWSSCYELDAASRSS